MLLGGRLPEEGPLVAASVSVQGLGGAEILGGAEAVVELVEADGGGERLGNRAWAGVSSARIGNDDGGDAAARSSGGAVHIPRPVTSLQLVAVDEAAGAGFLKRAAEHAHIISGAVGGVWVVAEILRAVKVGNLGFASGLQALSSSVAIGE